MVAVTAPQSNATQISNAIKLLVTFNSLACANKRPAEIRCPLGNAPPTPSKILTLPTEKQF